MSVPAWLHRHPGDPGFIAVRREAYRAELLTLREYLTQLRVHASVRDARHAIATRPRLSQNDGWPPPGF